MGCVGGGTSVARPATRYCSCVFSAQSTNSTEKECTSWDTLGVRMSVEDRINGWGEDDEGRSTMARTMCERTCGLLSESIVASWMTLDLSCSITFVKSVFQRNEDIGIVCKCRAE